MKRARISYSIWLAACSCFFFLSSYLAVSCVFVLLWFCCCGFLKSTTTAATSLHIIYCIGCCCLWVIYVYPNGMCACMSEIWMSSIHLSLCLACIKGILVNIICVSFRTSQPSLFLYYHIVWERSSILLKNEWHECWLLMRAETATTTKTTTKQTIISWPGLLTWLDHEANSAYQAYIHRDPQSFQHTIGSKYTILLRLFATCCTCNLRYYSLFLHFAYDVSVDGNLFIAFYIFSASLSPCLFPPLSLFNWVTSHFISGLWEGG